MSSLAADHPLPTINDPIIAERIFLHRSLGRTPVQTLFGDEDDNDKLAFLGDQVLQMCITEILFRSFPEDKTSALSPKKSFLVSKPQLAEWSQEYGLPSKIRGPAHQLPTIQTNKLQRAQVFQAYIAAYFLQEGYLRTKAWLAPVVEATYEKMLNETESREVEESLDESDSEPPTSPPQSSAPITPVASPRRDPLATPRISPRASLTSPKSPVKVPSNSLSIFNQTCSQNKLDPAWTELTQGPDHQRTFTMTLKLQGYPGVLGKGTAATKKQAQQLAAEQGLKRLPEITGQQV